jgi:hypothetical protein
MIRPDPIPTGPVIKNLLLDIATRPSVMKNVEKKTFFFFVPIR